MEFNSQLMRLLNVLNDPLYKRVIPLYKSGDVHDPSNYRPISLLSCISKIFEKVLKAQLYRYFIKFNILNDSQFGFREKLSTVEAIVSLCESIGKIENCSKTGFCSN